MYSYALPNQTTYYWTPNGFYCRATNSYCEMLNLFINQRTPYRLRRNGIIPDDALPHINDETHPCNMGNCRIARIVYYAKRR